MSFVCHVALLGLSPVDRTLIETLLRQDLASGVAGELVHDLHQADLIIANADDANTVHGLHARKLPAPVVLIGDTDAGTGWPVIARPIEPQRILQAIKRLTPAPGRAMNRVVPPSPSPSPRASGFEATVPFAPLEMAGRSGGAGNTSFEVTQPFERSAAGSLAAHAPGPRRQMQHEPIDARSVLMWRDAQVNPPVSAPVAAAVGESPVPRLTPSDGAVTEAASFVAPARDFPAFAGFETTRDADHPELAQVPGNWRDLARQQARAAHVPEQPAPPESENLSSSFADPADQPTLPPGIAAAGPVQAILLVGEERLAESSLIRALRGFGYQVDYVPDGDVALSRLASQDYGFVFLDAVSMRRQTLPVCRALRKRARALGQQRLHIVVIAKKGELLRRLLARVAGCDAWMTLPLERKRLGQFLRSRA
jgi:CheY-like chemotaxis protein